MTEERETLEIDVLFVGAGPACLAGAYHLVQKIKEHDEKAQGAEKIGEVSIAVIEKGDPIWAHAISGAVLDPKGLQEVIPDFLERGAPMESEVGKDRLYLLTEEWKLKIPWTPRILGNHGHYIVSLNKFVKWLGSECEKVGVDIFGGFPGVSLLIEEGRVVGVRTGDKGIGKDGKRKPNFEPGVDIRAKVTVLGEGPLGTLTKELIREFGLEEGKNPQIYATGLKEVWEIPEGRMEDGEVIHTMGYPLGSRDFGGGFIYKMSGNLVALGLVIGLDYADPYLDLQETLQKLKAHPFLRRLLEGGKMLHYGAKTIPEGGYFSIPKVYAPGALIVGDSAGLVEGLRLKGIHLAIKSGALAAEAILEALGKKDFSGETLSAYSKALDESWAMKEMYRSRNFRQPFRFGMHAGMMNAMVGLITKGRGIWARLKTRKDHLGMKTIDEYHGHGATPRRMDFDGKITHDKMTDVYNSGTKHEEDQPSHLLVPDTDLCRTRCKEEYGNPCQFFCPAQVYEMVADGTEGGLQLQLNPSNCVHCKTCEIKDPYENIQWVPPEGGGGPVYTNL